MFGDYHCGRHTFIYGYGGNSAAVDLFLMKGAVK